MAKYRILTYGHPCLRERAVLVKKVDAEIRRLARDMLETMYANRGLGLAAQQIGRREAICVVDVPSNGGREENSTCGREDGPAMPLVMVNPRLISASGEQIGQEGCLSFPEVFANIKRKAEVVVSFIDLENQPRTVRASGLVARAIQHEMDHLEGTLLVDRMSAVQKAAVAGRLRKLKREAFIKSTTGPS
ncbi:MAG: peptide deformylase [Kiritimatiellae bacterium]|nr:peptide deformylase [Kiritimatiellia bacterium]